MTILDNAIANYRASATLLGQVSRTRVDLLGSAAVSTHELTTFFEGFRSFGPNFDICLPSGARATLTFRRAGVRAIELETDEPAWMTLEGWLPELHADAAVCFVEIEIDSHEALVADIWVRVLDLKGRFHDLPTEEMQIPSGQPSVARLDLPHGEQPGSRCKVIVHLRQPPPQLSLRSFILTPL